MVQSLEIVQAPEPEIHYTLDTPSFSFGPYEFAQTPDCGYENSIAIHNLPDQYVVHDEDARTFTVA